MKFYISKGTWFDKGELCVPIWVQDDFGQFKGYRTCINPESEARPLGEKYLDEEICNLDEFEVIER